MTESTVRGESWTSGYLHPAYAESLSDLGSPRQLPRCRGWLLQRRIPGTAFQDAMGCYPIFSCADWRGLRDDLDELGGELLSVATVTDPFGEYDAGYLKECFGDVVIPFKEHFVTDLSRAPGAYVHAHHRRNAQKALREVGVERCENPSEFLDDWTSLYGTLAERHGIKGMTAFSRESFAKQLAVPGLVAFRAARSGTTVGMLLWYVQRGVAYYHLGAYSAAGYDLRASFALFWQSVEHFAAAGLGWLSLGAGAGLDGGGNDGLSRFKRGWATGTRTAYFCGRVLDRARYDEIVRARGVAGDGYFPAYRRGEFA
ncbi:MAG TPA: GNAT family N-acetyltransferase [Pyrinomonadaceae bacterium]|jgi:hypothetical protein|nr:GNAT family N-acetyltransferase [Pyrinomonadaceae bacterium]